VCVCVCARVCVHICLMQWCLMQWCLLQWCLQPHAAAQQPRLLAFCWSSAPAAAPVPRRLAGLILSHATSAAARSYGGHRGRGVGAPGVRIGTRRRPRTPARLCVWRGEPASFGSSIDWSCLCQCAERLRAHMQKASGLLKEVRLGDVVVDTGDPAPPRACAGVMHARPAGLLKEIQPPQGPVRV